MPEVQARFNGERVLECVNSELLLIHIYNNSMESFLNKGLKVAQIEQFMEVQSPFPFSQIKLR